MLKTLVVIFSLLPFNPILAQESEVEHEWKGPVAAIPQEFQDRVSISSSGEIKALANQDLQFIFKPSQEDNFYSLTMPMKLSAEEDSEESHSPYIHICFVNPEKTIQFDFYGFYIHFDTYVGLYGSFRHSHTETGVSQMVDQGKFLAFPKEITKDLMINNVDLFESLLLTEFVQDESAICLDSLYAHSWKLSALQTLDRLGDLVQELDTSKFIEELPYLSDLEINFYRELDPKESTRHRGRFVITGFPGNSAQEVRGTYAIFNHNLISLKLEVKEGVKMNRLLTIFILNDHQFLISTGEELNLDPNVYSSDGFQFNYAVSLVPSKK